MPNTNEFQEKARQQAVEAQRSSQPQVAVEEHPEDILMVRNILVDDATEVQETIPYSQARSDVDPGSPGASFANVIETGTHANIWNTKDFFEVRWDGRPHRIRPGETRVFPRYLADHFAKHLIDFVLRKEERRRGLTTLLTNGVERAKLYRQIIVEVVSYHNESLDEYQREGQRVEAQVAALNSPQRGSVHDLGEVPHPAIGYVQDITQDKTLPAPEPEPEVETREPAPVAPSSEPPKNREEAIAGKTRNDLFKEAKQLGIVVKGTETKAELYDAIVNF